MRRRARRVVARWAAWLVALAPFALVPFALAQAPTQPADAPAGVPGAAGRTLDVCATCDHATIGDALADAQDGDTVRVHPGRYAEGPLVIERSIVLEGVDWPVLDGELEHAILTVAADRVVVRGLVLRDPGRSHVRDVAAIRVEEIGGCLIEGNRVENAFFGIYLAKSTACTVKDNVVIGRAESEVFSGNAIHVWNGYEIRVLDNVVTGHRDGIYLEFALGNYVEGNVSEGNLRYGLHFMFSNESEFRSNVFRRNGAGVAVMYSKRISMLGNRFVDNWGAAAYGLLLKDIDDSFVSGNVFEGNTAGVYIDNSNRTDLDRNDFVRNGYAIRVLSNSMGMRIAHNNFVANTFDVITNADRSYNSFLENYWDAYEGYDLDRDGVGDVPYRPVRLFALTLEAYPQSMLLLRSPLSQVMEYAERLLPIITPKAIEDDRPLMGRIRWSSSTP